MSLRKAAKELNIKYSTAKTILQIFRREHRIAKKEKPDVISKRTLRHERRLTRLLEASRISKLIKRIIIAETRKKRSKKVKKAKVLHEIPTSTALPKDQGGLSTKNELPRVRSANQMMLFPVEENGPGANKVTRAVSTEITNFTQRKSIFKIVIKENLEEKYKQLINYNNLLITKEKVILHKPSVHKLPPIDIEERSLASEVDAKFSFVEYKAEILSSFISR